MTTTMRTPSTVESVLGTNSRIIGRDHSKPVPVVVSMGCPSGVGAEISLAVAGERKMPPLLLVGGRDVLRQAAKSLGSSTAKVDKIAEYDPEETAFSGLRLYSQFAPLSASEMRPGKPSRPGGLAQLRYIEEAYRIAKERGWPLCTAPVSKEAIAKCGEPRARKFRGHTEWLQSIDGARHSVMCFSSPKLTTSLVTTHVPVRSLARLITKELVAKAILELVDLLLRQGHLIPLVAVSSLNPHAGEGELLGDEEAKAIVPGIRRARKIIGANAKILGPIGGETAYRKGARGDFQGVVAMYHDQATIPMKLLDFGGAVNITQGLSIVRTSVDHGTAYDIAGKGIADVRGMREAVMMASLLGGTSRQVAHKRW